VGVRRGGLQKTGLAGLRFGLRGAGLVSWRWWGGVGWVAGGGVFGYLLGGGGVGVFCVRGGCVGFVGGGVGVVTFLQRH